MPKERIVVGIDVGTYNTYTVIGVNSPEYSLPQITGIGKARSQGVRRGIIINTEEAVESIKQSVQEASSSAGVSISSAMLSVGGNHIVSFPSRGTIAVSRADGKISKDDIVRVLDAAKTISLPPNKEVLHTIPNEYMVDGEGGLQDVEGMTGLRLETNALIVGAASSHLRNLEYCLSEAGFEIESFVLSILASSRTVLSNRQKEIGVACIDIGGGTTDIAIFEEGEMVYTDVIPLGGEAITNDIAIGLRTKIEIAEKIKKEYGIATVQEADKSDIISLSEFDSSETDTFTRREVATIMEARLKEIFEEVNKKLKDAKKEALLPGGVVLVGGSAKIRNIVDLCKQELKLPCRIGFPKEAESVLGSIEDPSLASALGLVFWQLEQEDNASGYISKVSGPIEKEFSGILSKLGRWLKTFLP